MLLLAVHWSRVDNVLKQAGDLAGKVIVSCSLPMNAANTELVIAHTSSGAEALASAAGRRRGAQRSLQRGKSLRRTRGLRRLEELSRDHGREG